MRNKLRTGLGRSDTYCNTGGEGADTSRTAKENCECKALDHSASITSMGKTTLSAISDSSQNSLHKPGVLCTGISEQGGQLCSRITLDK